MRKGRVHLAAAIIGFLAAMPLSPSGAASGDGISIDIPVALKQAKVVFNLDHLAFEGDQPTGLSFLRLMVERFRQDRTDGQIVAIFHGAAGYMALDDSAYDRVRNWRGGNPYKEQIAALIREGVDVEECGQTMLDNGWVNADLLPGVKVNGGAVSRIVGLVQEGYVQIQP